MDRNFESVKIADSYRKKCLVWGTGLAGAAVVLGALGAHALKQYLTVAQMGSFETAVRFQFLHALALLALAAVPQLWQPHAGVRKLLAWGTATASEGIQPSSSSTLARDCGANSAVHPERYTLWCPWVPPPIHSKPKKAT